MQFICRIRKWASITRDARLQTTAATEHKTVRRQMICQIVDKIIEQTKQYKSQPINSTKNNQHTNNKTNQKIDYFITGPGMEAEREVGTKINIKNTSRIWQCFAAIGCFKGTFFLQVKDTMKPYQTLQDA